MSDGYPCWVRGGYPGSQNDVNMFRHYGLAERLIEHEYILADRGYQGAARCLTPFKCMPGILDADNLPPLIKE